MLVVQEVSAAAVMVVSELTLVCAQHQIFRPEQTVQQTREAEAGEVVQMDT